MELVPIAEVPPIFYKDSAKIPVMQANGEIKKGFGRIQILFCDSGGIQTHNLLIRSQMLYSVELRSQKQSYFLIASAKLQLSAVTANLFIDFFPLS